MAKKSKSKKSSVKAAVRAAGPTISKKEMSQITKAAKGNVSKALDTISSVQKSMWIGGKQGPSLQAGAANSLIKQAAASPGFQFGSSKLGNLLSSMVPRAGTPGTMVKGSRVGGTEGQKGSLVPGGMVIRPSGQLAVRGAASYQEPSGKSGGGGKGGKGGGGGNTNRNKKPNPNKALLDQIKALTNELNIMKGDATTMQDIFNQGQEDFNTRIGDLSGVFNEQIGSMQQNFADQIAQMEQYYADQLAIRTKEEEEAARAFMINQGRMGSPANLQLGATYGTPQLAGTQGFKYRPQRLTTPAQVATAFTAPTLAASAATPQQQQLQPTVLNV